MNSPTPVAVLKDGADSSSAAGDHALPDEILAVFGEDESLLVLSNSEDLDSRFMLHAGDFTYQLEPLGRFNPHVLPLELLGNADPSRGACLLGTAGKYRVGWDLEEKWRISDTPTRFVEIDPSNGLFELAYSNDGDLRIPVRPQSKYLFSGYFALHRTKSRVMRFFAAGGRLIETIERQIRAEFPGGREAANYDRIELMVTAPPGARHATLVLTYDGAHHPIDWPGYIYFASMSLRPAPVGHGMHADRLAPEG